MMQQLSDFVSRAVPPAEEWSAPLLTLWVGQRACACRQVAMQAIQALRTPGAPVRQVALAMAGQTDADFEFAPWEQLPPSLGSLAREPLQKLNILLWDTIDELLWSENGQTAAATLAAYVWADDPLAAVAAQLLRLAAQRYQFSAGMQARTVLVVMVPMLRELRQTAQAAAVRRMLDGFAPSAQWPAAFLEMEDSEPTAEPDLPEQEVYFVSGERMLAENSATLLRPLDGQLADAACLLLPEARSPGGRYLPAFLLSGQAEQHRLLAGLADGIDQLEVERKDGRCLPVEELLRQLEDRVTREEASREQFRSWMSRACVYRNLTARTEQAVFGDWLEQLYAQWEQQLQQCPVPDQLLDEMVRGLPRRVLAEYREQLRVRKDRPLAEQSAAARSGIGRLLADRSQLLEELLTERYNTRYDRAVQQRIRLLTHCLIERIDRRLEQNVDGPDYAALREQIGRTLKEWQWDGCPNESGLVLKAEDKNYLHRLLAQTLQPPQDYTALLRFVQERLPQTTGQTVPVELACQTISLERTHTQPVCLLKAGPRRGQQLQRLKLDEQVYSEGEMHPVGAQTGELRLFMKVQRISV